MLTLPNYLLIWQAFFVFVIFGCTTLLSFQFFLPVSPLSFISFFIFYFFFIFFYLLCKVGLAILTRLWV
jgi:hypothetical protein